MRNVGWAIAILLVVPVQVTLLQYGAIGEIRPDLCLILACLSGFLWGERHGLLAGLAIGFLQDLASADQLWLNLLTKAVGGLVSGIMGRQLVQATALSFLVLLLAVSGTAGVLFLFVGRPPMTSWIDALLLIKFVLLPQAAYDAVVGATLCWLVLLRMGVAVEGEAAA